jgi:folate-binding protein YgfZ
MGLEGVQLVDRSDAGKLALVGPQAREFLDGQVTNEVASLEVGAGAYAALLTPKGKMLGDLRVLRVAENELLLICERVALQAIFDTVRRALLGWDAELEKRTVQMGLLSLIGQADALIPGLDAEEHASEPFDDGFAVRTDVGIDLVVPAERTEAMRATLLADGVSEINADVAEVLRVERGRPRYGVDLDDSVIPQEAGLNERAVSFTKGCYVGQETVARLHYKGKPNRHLRGLRLSEPLPNGTALRLGAKEVGTISSSVVSPDLGPIALALVRREVAPGDEIEAGGAKATVVELPFRATR